MIVAFGMPGPTEWFVILAIVLIFFGVGKLPQVLSQMGKGVKAFKDGMNDDDDTDDDTDDDDKADRKEIDVTPSATTVAKDAEEVHVHKT